MHVEHIQGVIQFCYLQIIISISTVTQFYSRIYFFAIKFNQNIL